MSQQSRRVGAVKGRAPARPWRCEAVPSRLGSTLLLFLALLAAGCTAVKPAVPGLPSLSAADLQRLVADRRQALHSLRSEASIAVSSPDRSAKARQFLIAERPDRLRVEVFSPFGVAFVLATGQGDLAAYVREENRVYRGAATPENLARYTALDLHVADVVDLLLGGPPQRTVRSASVFAEPSTRLLRLRQETDRGAQVVLFGGDPLLPVEVQELDSEGELLWRATFGNYQAAAGVAVPRRIGIEVPRTEERLEITLDEPEANPPLAASLFGLQTPPGSADVNL